MKSKLINQKKVFITNRLFFLFICIFTFIKISKTEHLHSLFPRKKVKTNIENFNLNNELNNTNGNEEIIEINLNDNLDNGKEETIEINLNNTLNDDNEDIVLDFNLDDPSSNNQDEIKEENNNTNINLEVPSDTNQDKMKEENNNTNINLEVPSGTNQDKVKEENNNTNINLEVPSNNQDKMEEENKTTNFNNSSNNNNNNNNNNNENNVTVTRVDPSEIKKEKIKFTPLPPMTPIKYLPDEEKKELRKKLDEMVSISSSGVIDNFTGFEAQLNTLEKKIYDEIVTSSRKSPPDLEIILKFSISEYQSVGNKLSLESILTAIISQHTELWWIGSFSTESSSSGNYYYIKLKFNVDTNDSLNQIVNINKKFEVMKEDIVAKISALNLTTDYAKIKYIHDYLVTKIVYTYGRSHIRTLYGALVENKCVCEGYAEAFQYLAHYYNIDCIIARSDGHEWNFVKLNNKWYALDVTWDDPQISSQSMEPTGSSINLQTTYFLIGQDTKVDSTTPYKNEKDHQLVFTAFNSQNIAVQYPTLSNDAYAPSNTEKQEASKITVDIFFTSLSIALPNCALKNKSIKCPTTVDYFCIDGDNVIYKSTGSTCKRTYYESLGKTIVFLKDNNGYTEFMDDSTTDSSEFIIYECTNSDGINSGCTIYTEEYYHDKTNKHIFHLESNYQFKQLRGTTYEDDKGDKYICDAEGFCDANIYPGYYLAGTQTSNKYNELIKCSKTTVGRKTSITCDAATAPTVDGYYINGSTFGKSLIECTNTSSSPSCYESIPSNKVKTSGYAYLDAGNSNSSSSVYSGVIVCTNTECSSVNKPSGSDKNYYIDGSVSSGTDIITCDSTSCTSSSVTKTKGYAYIDGTTKGSVLLSDGNRFNPTASGANSSTSKYYIDGSDPSKIITCAYDSSSRQVLCTSGDNMATSTSKTYFIDSGISGNLIECTTSTCTSKTVNVGYYLSGATNYPLINCVNTSTQIQCSLVHKGSVRVAYYLNGNATTNNTKYTSVIYCSSSTSCSEVTTTTKGYYLNGSTVSASPLIYSDGSFYTSLQTANIGYYLDGSSSTNGNDYTQVIKCTSSSSCTIIKTTYKGYYLDGSSLLTNVSKKRATTTTYSKLIICDGNKYNSVTTTNQIGYYLDGSSTTNNTQYYKVIYCSSATACSSITSTIKGYYLDGTSTTDNKKYSKMLLCNGSVYTSPTTLMIGYYLDGSTSTNSINYSNLIYCESSTSCSTMANNTIQEGFYLEGGTAASTTSYTQLITCTANSNTTSCKMHNNVSSSTSYVPYDGYYLSGMSDSNDSPLVYCLSKSCNKVAKTAINTGYYMEGSTSTVNGMKYTNVVTCTVKEGSTSDCMIQSLNDGYYVNAESTDLTNAIFYCSNKNCIIQTPSSGTSYYVGADDSLNGLIACSDPNIGLNQCVFTPAINSQGYYLNAGSNNTSKQLIICDTTVGCQDVKVDLGYYVNAGDLTSHPTIRCQTVGQVCVVENPVSCPTASTSVAGDHCYEDGKLKFFGEDKSEAVYATKSDDFYINAVIVGGKFPGISKTIKTIFKVSRYSINRYDKQGVVMIDETGKIVDSVTPSTGTIIYDCSNSAIGCQEVVKCTINTYMYDSENQKAIYCNNGVFENAKFTGYVINTDLATNNGHPYLIKCENNGEKCSSIKTNTASYYANQGYDSSYNPLIFCDGNNCTTQSIKDGYYVAHEGKGYLYCSGNICTFYQHLSTVKFINAGYDNNINGIINCVHKSLCSTTVARSGYYMTNNKSVLIYCTGPASCTEINPSVGYYENADTVNDEGTIINCAETGIGVVCSTERVNNGYYTTYLSNRLIRCRPNSPCKSFTPENGYFRGATKRFSSWKRSLDTTFNTSDKKKDSLMMKRASDESYNIIKCLENKCRELSASELAAIPICEYNNDKCYITQEYSRRNIGTASLQAGGICTNEDRSIFYFATDTVVVKPDIISAVTSTYTYTTTTSNCVVASDEYIGMYFTVGSHIYQLEKDSVIEFYDLGYYFINVESNTLMNGNSIEDYNHPSVKIYKCNGVSCSILDKPSYDTYYADINKRIIKYDVKNNAYTFAYNQDVICVYENNKCTPNADLINQEFCLTYKGELVLAQSDIKSRETGDCYRANDINTNIYGHSQYFYNMNLFSAEMINQNGYYIISLSTNNTYVINHSKKKHKTDHLIIYGCQNTQCKIYEPQESVYYYDSDGKNLLQYKDGQWITPSTSGYAYISIDPANTSIYHFTKTDDDYVVDSMSEDGYYYTVDNEMYYCDDDYSVECSEINNNGYYFTNGGEIYYCVHDSEYLEDTECIRQQCVNGQYYYLNNNYYFCDTRSLLVPVISRYCIHDHNVVVNFPIEMTNEYPWKVRNAMRRIEKNNNSTAVVSRRGQDYLDSVSGIFTNCTYNVEGFKAYFDLLCLNNYVKIDTNTLDAMICSVDHLNYVECVEDEQNLNKCNVSASIHVITNPSVFFLIIITLLLTIYHYYY